MVLLWSVFLVSLVSAIPIGLQAGLGITAVNNFKNEALPYILASIGTIELPPRSFHAGKGLYELTAQIENFTLGDLKLNTDASTVVFESPDTIKVDLRQISGTSSFVWSYETAIAADTGSGHIYLGNTSAQLHVALEMEDYKLKVTVKQVSVSVVDLSIQFSNNPTAQYINWLLNAFNEDIQAAVNQQLNTALTIATQEMFDQLFAESSTFIPLGGLLAIDYSLPKSPTVNPDYIELYSQAVIVEIADPNDSPPITKPVALPHFNLTEGQIQISLSQYTVNSGLYAAVNADLLKFNVTNEDLKQLPLELLNTNTLEFILPGISAKYGVNQPCYLLCEAQAYPSIDFTAGSIQGTGTFDCSFVVVKGNQVAVNLAITTEFAASAELVNWEVKGTVDSLAISDLSVVSSTLGSDINVDDMKESVNIILNSALGSVNEYLAGYKIPLPAVKGVDMTASSVTIKQGYLLVQSTPKYSY